MVSFSRSRPGSAYFPYTTLYRSDAAHLSWAIQAGDPGSISGSGLLSDAIGTLASGGRSVIHTSEPQSHRDIASLRLIATTSDSNASPPSASGSLTDT